MRSKNGVDCTGWFDPVATSLSAYTGKTVIVDGEMTVLDAHGRTDFDALHARARRRRSRPDDLPLTYVIFDLLALDGNSLMDLPLVERKAQLAKLLDGGIEHTVYARHISIEDTPEPVTWFYQVALQLELEGVVGKLKDSVYTPGVRSAAWFKLKRPGATPVGRFKRGFGRVDV